VAAVVQDSATSEVLALCYLNSTTLARTLETGTTEFLAAVAPDVISKEGKLADVRSRLDGSFLTIVVERSSSDSTRESPAKDTTAIASERALDRDTAELSLIDPGSLEFGVTVNDLFKLIEQRNEKRPEGSYTTYLFNSGLDKILKKISEEAGEVVIASKNNSSRELIGELADLFYHLLVLMVERGIKPGDIQAELAQRSGSRGAQTNSE
jgi:phosphoribosyl-ATP pyrophosphohydrolase/phosphoribosyl-AMP cyclohydrolase